MRKLTMILVAATLALTGCKDKNKDDQPAGPGTATGTGTAAGTAAAGTGTGTAAGMAVGTPVGTGAGTGATGELAGGNKAGNCPSAVAGATTTIIVDKDAPNAIVLTIVATESAATETIRRRVAHLLEVQGAPDAEVKHTGEGTGGAGMGMCPVITTKDTRISGADIEGGSKVKIELTAGQNRPDVVKDIEGRIAKTAEWTRANQQGTATSGGGGGVGGGQGDHGGNHSGDGDGKGKERAPGPGTGTGTAPGTGAGTGI